MQFFCIETVSHNSFVRKKCRQPPKKSLACHTHPECFICLCMYRLPVHKMLKILVCNFQKKKTNIFPEPKLTQFFSADPTAGGFKFEFCYETKIIAANENAQSWLLSYKYMLVVTHIECNTRTVENFLGQTNNKIFIHYIYMLGFNAADVARTHTLTQIWWILCHCCAHDRHGTDFLSFRYTFVFINSIVKCGITKTQKIQFEGKNVRMRIAK